MKVFSSTHVRYRSYPIYTAVISPGTVYYGWFEALAAGLAFQTSSNFLTTKSNNLYAIRNDIYVG